MSYHWYRTFEYDDVLKNVIYLLISVFRLIFDQRVCFRVRKFLRLSIFRVVFLDFQRPCPSFLPQSFPTGERCVDDINLLALSQNWQY